MACTLPGSATFTSWKKASRHSVAVASPFSGSTSATQMLAPSPEKRIAASRPMPPAAPVITATFPSRRPMRGASLPGKAGENRVEPIEALVGGLFFRAAEPDEDDVPPVALVGDPGLALRVELPVDAVGAPGERLVRVLVLEEGGERGALPRLADVDVEDAVAVDQRLRHVEAEAELVPRGVADRGRLERPPRRLLERLPHLGRSEGLLLGLVAGGAAPGQNDKGEDREREQGDASHCAQRVAPRLNGGLARLSRPAPRGRMGGPRTRSSSMFTKRKLIALFAATVIVAGVLVVAAIGATGSGTADQVTFRTSNRVDTPSGSFINTGSQVVVNPGTGPMLIRFSATGYEQDFNSGGGFAGHKYAAMFVRVLVNGSQVGPAVRFFDNTGKVGVQKPRPTTTSYEWALNTTLGSKTVRVQFKNLNTFDSATILHSTLTVQN